MNAFFFLLVILGSLQGLVTAVLLYRKKPVSFSRRLLAAIVLFIALPGIHLYGHYTGWFNGTLPADMFHAIIPWVTIMALGPLVYFYTRASADPDFSIQRSDYIHFLPVLIDLFPKLMEIVFLAGGLAFWERQAFMDQLDVYNKYADIPRWISLTSYVFVSAKYLSNTAAPVSKSVQRFISALKIFACIWFCYLIPYLIPASGKVLKDTVGWLPVYIPMSVLIYWTGITHLYQSAGDISRKKTDAIFPPALLEQTAGRLLNKMDTDKPFLDPGLDLASVAEQLQVSPKLISATVNQVLEKSFNQFINEYRVETFKRRVLEPGARNMTITGLAASCGFSSPATFQRSFKQITGYTPTAFMRLATETIEQ